MPSIRGRVAGLVPGIVRRNATAIGLVTYAVVLFGLVGVLTYFAIGYPVDEAAVQAVEDDPAVNVTTNAEGDWVLRDPDPEVEETGLVFYPGARVNPRSYVPVLAPLVRDGNVTVVIPRVPINVAILDTKAAGRSITAYSGVEDWYVGGHSLGGAMACRYASNHAGKVEGVVLFGAYCASDASETELNVLVVSGTEDGVIDRNSLRNNRENLPPGSAQVSVAGVNHTYFGSYYGQSGDGTTNVSRSEAHRRLYLVARSWLGTHALPEVPWLEVERIGSENEQSRLDQSPPRTTRSAAT
jgi:hypothetical protein